MARLRMLEHTADVGFEVEADSLAGVFEAAADALLRVLFEGGLPRRGRRTERLALTAPDLETLMVRWLDELIYRVQTRGEVPVRTRVRLGKVPEGQRLEAELDLLLFEEVQDRFAGEVKAATYHGLVVEGADGRFRARVILDV
ncbi:archease family protein [Oceanithermus profundus DSM 14977]|uniref:Archease family protein n=1 Tax=Oceanithermus profundus (strain DSM 14977 / NBRC 100410 / VKM B-2274 / 506) TaxID=670487 RepID=E4U6L0_OCEP5|nr:archease [Oceanithermus profundus]ADR35748.1 archease family protein [Oceanithermus profundus DSM 14977]